MPGQIVTTAFNTCGSLITLPNCKEEDIIILNFKLFEQHKNEEVTTKPEAVPLQSLEVVQALGTDTDLWSMEQR